MGFKVRATIINASGVKCSDYLSRNWEDNDKSPPTGLWGSPICQYTFGANDTEATIFDSKKEAEQAVEIRNQKWGKKNPIASLELIEV